MLKSYKYYLITEGKREKTIKKYKDKILKFLNSHDLAQWIVDMCISTDSINGIKYSLWIANQFKDSLYHSIIKTTDEETAKNALLDENELAEWNPTIRTTKATFKPILSGIIDWLKSPARDEEVNLSTLTMRDAYFKSNEWHDNLKASGIVSNEEGDIVLSYDDGYYWIDLLTGECREEADAMGHCASTSKGTLFSLRHKMKPHVTMSFNKETRIIYQMKGKNNKKPINKYHTYILDFLIKMKVKGFGSEYRNEDDFNLSDLNKEQFDKLLKENTHILDEMNIKDIYELLKLGHLTYNQINNIEVNLTYRGILEIIIDSSYNDEKFMTYLKSLYEKLFPSNYNEDSESHSLNGLSNYFRYRLWFKKFITTEDFFNSLLDRDKKSSYHKIKYENGKIFVYYDWYGEFEYEKIDFEKLSEDAGDMSGIIDNYYSYEHLQINQWDYFHELFYPYINKYFKDKESKFKN